MYLSDCLDKTQNVLPMKINLTLTLFFLVKGCEWERNLDVFPHVDALFRWRMSIIKDFYDNYKDNQSHVAKFLYADQSREIKV